MARATNALYANYDASATLWGGQGNDHLVGSPGADTIYPGPGVDSVSADAGDDTVVILDPCEIQSGKVLDGGSGTDTLYTPVSLSQLQSMGVTVTSFERVVVDTQKRYLSECF